MSRKFILSLATAATIITVGLASGAADARGFGGGGGGAGAGHAASGGHFGGSHFAGTHSSGRSRVAAFRDPRRGYPGRWPRDRRWRYRDGVWIDVGGVDGTDETSGPCTCLTKTYTRDGLVVFADVCTKEAASARVDGSADTTPVPPVGGKSSDATQAPTPASVPVDGKAADATQAPTSANYAGRTFKDFLAANMQAGSQPTLKN
jgi:hypothetical protein